VPAFMGSGHQVHRFLCKWLHHSRVPRIFLVTATILSALYIVQLPSFLYKYPHQSQRFFHVASFAYKVVYGVEGKLPVGLYALKYFPYQPVCKRKWVKKHGNAHCLPRSIKKEERKLSFWKRLHMPLLPEQTINFKDHRNAAVFPILAYLPHVVAAIIGIWAHAPPVLILYGGIILNAILVTGIGYYTLRILPVLRWPLFCLLLLPIGMMFRLYVMPDALAIELSYMLFASVIALAFAKRALKASSWLYLIVMAFLAGVMKIGYGLYSLLFFIIPAHYFGGAIRRIVCVVLPICAVLAFSLAWGVYHKDKYLPESPYVLQGGTVLSDVISQARYVLTHPVVYTKRVYSAIMYKRNLQMNVGNIIGWPHYSYPQKLHPIFYVFLLLITLLSACEGGDRSSPRFSLSNRAVAAFTLIAGILLLYTVRFLYFPQNLATPEKFYFGMQGRYYLPLIPFLLLVLHGVAPLRNYWKQFAMNIIVIFSLGFIAYLHYTKLTFGLF